MAKGTMANYTGAILWRSPNNIAGLLTRRVNGAALYPGFVVTENGETTPDAYIPDGNDDESLGIALDNADADIDTAFADNVWIVVAAVRSGAGVWGYIDDNEGTLAMWTALYSTGVDDDGYLEKMAVTAAPTTYDDATIQGIIDYLEASEHRYVGRAATYVADQGSDDVPQKVLLV